MDTGLRGPMNSVKTGLMSEKFARNRLKATFSSPRMEENTGIFFIAGMYLRR